MPYRKISADVKLAAIRLHYNQLLSLRNILDAVGFSHRTFYRIKCYYDDTGNVTKPRNPNARPQGRPRLLHVTDLEYLICLIRLA
jgi:transposase